MVDHHAGDGAPGAGVVAVVGAPAGVLDDGDAFGAERGEEPVRGEGSGHLVFLRT
ncbi:hypothetical protein GCM10017674_61770 [Streptomyces gardneri]|uniref:Uncharacterized protein n=1 Tax=Streptomyces gardneri TaxID=66892 RepID=A0A4Y3RIP9_9ACTN|nr:hypothetical protein SGA01_21680 [Streptomyces gardneri]GHH13878.1 hypothetical protein GCM10017674_61770 [Streptomyces gardneri]